MREDQNIQTSIFKATDIIGETGISEEFVFRDEETDIEAEAIGTSALDEMFGRP